MSRKRHLLVVDDDPGVRTMLSRYFSEEGFDVTVSENGATMRAALASERVDLILLDLVLPGEDGFILAREVRSHSQVPIIMLTGRSDVVDRVVGLEVGADDYIAKPFHLREVLARVKSVLRRTEIPVAAEAPASEVDGEAFAFEGWQLDVSRRRLASPDGDEVVLTTGEFDLLLAFVSNPGRVLDRDRLMDLTRGRAWDALDRTIDAQISRLRKKIEPDTRRPELIKSVRGVGYLFAAKVRRQRP